MNNIDINNGSYLSSSLESHIFDNSLAFAISDFFKNENCEYVADFGCGPGWYTNTINNTNKVKCDGFDANPNTILLAKQHNYSGNFYITDLTKDVNLNNKYEWILCLEVGEHIPEKFENILIQNLHSNNTKGIILSWAIEGQDGPGHVNCKNNDYIKNKLSELNYINDIEIENQLRNSVTNAVWFKNTIMVFRKQ
jgi:2-polyprenyl-3-methyl-5-hydroxy-6-metoxy-1,4-benzoquinol methylase